MLTPTPRLPPPPPPPPPTRRARALQEALHAPGPVWLRWDYTVPQIKALAAALMVHSKALSDAAVAAHAAGALTWDGVVVAVGETAISLAPTFHPY